MTFQDGRLVPIRETEEEFESRMPGRLAGFEQVLRASRTANPYLTVIYVHDGDMHIYAHEVILDHLRRLTEEAPETWAMNPWHSST